MKRRVCESCHFYQAAGIVNSGWCRHPDRQFSTGVRLIVRGNELNCRNGWGVDLWVPAGIEPGEEDGSPAEWSAAEQQDDQITSIVPARYEPREPADVVRIETEDVVVRYAPYADYAPPEKEARDLVTNPRAAILKAREQFKVRQLREGRIADRFDRPVLADADAEPPNFPSANNPHGRGDDFDDPRPENAPFLDAGASSARRMPETTRYSVPPVSRDEMNRPFVSITHFPEDDRRFESLPNESEDTPVRQASPEDFHDTEPELESAIVDDQIDDWFDDELIAENGRPVDPPRPRRMSFVDRLLAGRRRRKQPIFDEPEYLYDDGDYGMDGEPGEYVSDVQQFDPPLLDPQNANYAPPPRVEPVLEPVYPATGRPEQRFQPQPPLPHKANGRSHPSDAYEDDLEWAMAPIEETEYIYPSGSEERPSSMPAPRHEAPVNRRHDLDLWQREAAFANDEYDVYQPLRSMDELPRWNGAEPGQRESVQPPSSPRNLRVLAPDMPQICRTCRDFRPTESGDRGWCNNSHAFMHRRMVDADVLSCASSYGHWWLPHDSVWQKAADVSRHALETPLLDRLLGMHDYADPPPRSGSGR